MVTTVESILREAQEKFPLDLVARLEWLHQERDLTERLIDAHVYTRAINLTRNGRV